MHSPPEFLTEIPWGVSPSHVWTVQPVTIPDRLTLGPHQWQVRTDHDTTTYLRDQGQRGTTDVCTHTIRVDADGLGPGAARETLLHEAIHACFHTAGLDAEGSAANEHAEQVITALAPQLLHLLRANPTLLTYLTDA